jgi:formate dehydrogenase major subunit
MTLSMERDLGTPAPPHGAKPVTVEVDGLPVTVGDGTSVLRAAALAGIDIPTLCATDSLDRWHQLVAHPSSAWRYQN